MTGGRPERTPEATRPDLPARLLGLGLAAMVIALPLPFGAVGPASRLALEIGAGLLGLTWLMRAFFYATPLPPRTVRVGALGLLLLAALQMAPLGPEWVARVSPASFRVWTSPQPGAAALEAEERLLGRSPAELDAAPSLSVDPAGTASAARAGVALVVLLLVATTVAGVLGVRGLACALLVSAAFQGLHGLVVLISGYDQIWHLPKRKYLDAATGTFVNPNHYSSFLGMALACGLGLILLNARTVRSGRVRHPLLRALGAEGSRNLILILLLVLGLAGLLASFSRAGIAIGVVACLTTLLAARGSSGLRLRLVVGGLTFCAAVVPLAQIGSDRLIDRFSESVDAISGPGARGTVWRDTLAMTTAYPLAGTGYGTFATIYPLYRSPSVRGFYTHAHNDLLQAIAEGGLPGTLLLLLVLFPLAGVAARSFAGAKGIPAVGFAAGTCAVLLHSLVDFPFHIPANAATAAILAGALLGLPWLNRN